jgi:hypothetical protein
MAILDRDLRIEELAITVFLAEHICSRNPFELDPAVSTEQASLLMQLYELDQAPVAGSGGSQIVLRMNLDVDRSGKKVGQFAVDTPAEHWVDHNASLHHSLEKLTEHGWLFVSANRSLFGTIGRQDLGRPTISAYLLAVILGLERGLRRLYGSYQGRPIPDEPKPHVSQQDAGERPDNFTTTIKYTLSCDKLLRDLGFQSISKCEIIWPTPGPSWNAVQTRQMSCDALEISSYWLAGYDNFLLIERLFGLHTVRRKLSALMGHPQFLLDQVRHGCPYLRPHMLFLLRIPTNTFWEKKRTFDVRRF